METRDTSLSLGDIHGGNYSELLHQLVDIQAHEIRHKRSINWAHDLRFLDVCSIRRRKQKSTIYLTSKGSNVSCRNYIALSYRWSPSPEPDPKYVILDKNGLPRGNKIHNHLLSRVIRFAQRHNIRFIWIDQECMDHTEGSYDKTVGIQAMDIFYRRSCCPVGLLTVAPYSKTKFGFLEWLVARFGRDRHETLGLASARGSRWNMRRIRKTLNVIRGILQDEWWKRAWIFQEEYCGSTRMKLLVPLEAQAQAPRQSRRGPTWIDFELSTTYFRVAVTRFCLYAEKLGLECQDILRTARKYQILNEQLADNRHGPSKFRGCSIDIMMDVEDRGIENAFDQLAIIANCCNYSRRLNGYSLQLEETHALSTSILALFLLNGEILRSEKSGSDSSHTSILSYRVHDFLYKRVLSDFNPPGEEKHLTFIKRCRFPYVSLSIDGMWTRGWLWELDHKLAFRLPKLCTDKSFLLARLLKALRNFPQLRRRMIRFARKDGRLLCDIDQNGLHFDPEVEPLQSREYQKRMLDALLHAVEDGESLFVARIRGQKHSSGLFIGSSVLPNEAVFTSWSNEGGGKIPNFVSLKVQVRHNPSNVWSELRTQEWINGLWFASRKKSKGYGNTLFAWPF